MLFYTHTIVACLPSINAKCCSCILYHKRPVYYQIPLYSSMMFMLFRRCVLLSWFRPVVRPSLRRVLLTSSCVAHLCCCHALFLYKGSSLLSSSLSLSPSSSGHRIISNVSIMRPYQLPRLSYFIALRRVILYLTE